MSHRLDEPRPLSKFASVAFWTGTFDRAVSTFAQTALGSFVVGQTGLIGLNWLDVASIAGAAALMSVLQSVAFRGAPTDPHNDGLGGTAPEVSE